MSRTLAQRLCPCHGKRVWTQYQLDAYGNQRQKAFCPVDNFDLGFDGGVDQRDWQTHRRVANARLFTATARSAAMEVSLER